jgi:uncharacterized protein (TIGR03437 family)
MSMKFRQPLLLAALCLAALAPGFAQTIRVVVGSSTKGFADGVPAAQAQINGPTGVGLDAAGDLYFADSFNYRVRVVSAASGNVTTVAGNGQILNPNQANLPPGPALQFPLYNPGSLVVGNAGTIYFSDYAINAVSTAGILTPDYGPAAALGLSGLAVDGKGNLYAISLGGTAVYLYQPGLSPVVVAGDPNNAEDDNVGGADMYPLGDKGPALQAHFFEITGIAADSAGNVYVSDPVNCRIRKFLPGGIITTIAGTGTCNSSGSATSGDGGLAASTALNLIGAGGGDGGAGSIAVDPAGNVYFADSSERIRKISTSGIITGYAGEIGAGGGHTYPGDGGSALQASLDINFLATDSQGDLYVSTGIQNTIFEIKPSAAATIPPVIAGVISAAANENGLTPQSWISIYGTNMSNSTRSWDAADFNGNTLPDSLDGVSVTVDGLPAALDFISPGQINVQVPDDSTLGPVPIVVTNNGTSSAPYMVTMLPYAPAFFVINSAGDVAALHLDYSLVAPVGLTGNSSPASAGETVVLYGTGFGPTTPAVPTGMLVTSPAPLSGQYPLTLTVGGMPATVEYAALVAVGLYQFNVTLPQVASGNQPVVATLGTSSTQAGVVIPIQ